MRLATLAVALLLQAAASLAVAREPTPSLDTSACDTNSGARLQWLVERLDQRSPYADLWWKGWLGIYTTGAVLQGVRAGIEHDQGHRADYVVSAVKAVGGVTRLALSQPTARLGADPLRGERITSEAACRQRVEHGEALLGDAAQESERRWDWKAHLVNVAVNFGGAVIVTEGFEENDGWASAGVGIAVGEAMLWSHPWTGGSDVEEYQQRFAAGGNDAPRWAVLPYRRGLQMQVTF